MSMPSAVALFEADPRRRYSGRVTRFHPERGWGFVELNGVDIMVHVNDCKPEDVELFTGGQPQVGDTVSFEIEPRKDNPEHMQAKRVIGGTDERCCNTKGKGQVTPVQGSGQFYGVVKAFNAKGFGWIESFDGSRTWVELRDCVGSRPVTGDRVQFDLQLTGQAGRALQAVNVTGGTAPLDLKDAVLSRDMAKAKAVAATAAAAAKAAAAAAAKDTKAMGPQLTLKKNAQGHLVGCVCSRCQRSGISDVVATTTITSAAMDPMQLQRQLAAKRPGPYSGGMGSMGRLY